MPVKENKCCESFSLSNYVITLSGDPDDGKQAGTVIEGFSNLLCNVKILGQQICSLKLHIQNLSIAEDHCEIQVYLLESSEASTPNARWDYLKYLIRQFSKKLSIDKAKKRKARKLELESKVKEFEKQLTTASNHQLINDYNKCKEELESLYE